MTGWARDSWLREERSSREVGLYILNRARRRLVVVSLVAAACASLLVLARLRKDPVYAGTALMSLTEGVTTGSSPQPPGALYEFISKVALNRTRLVEIMKRHHRYPAKGPTGEQIELYRERIEISVTENHLGDYYDEEGKGKRSATVMIEFASGDPDEVRETIHEIAESFIETTNWSRESRVASARALLANAVKLGQERLQGIDRDLRALAVNPDPSLTRAMIAARQADLQLLRPAVEAQVKQYQAKANENDLTASAEAQGVGLTFQLVNEDLTLFSPPLSPLRAVATLIMLFIVMFPISAVVVGAFDRTVFAREDLTFLSLPVLGVLPRFPGDTAGSLADRIRRRKKNRV